MKSKEVKQEKKQEKTYKEWFFRKEGTVAEPWATAEELLNNPHVRETIKIVRSYNKSLNKKK